MRVFLFIMFSWGVIIALPIVFFFATRNLWPSAHVLVPFGVALVAFVVGLLSGEWLARIVNAVLDKIFTRPDAQSHDTTV